MSVLIGSCRLYSCVGDKPFYYQVKPVSAFLLSVATWGFYSYWWHFQNWRLIKINAEPTISPLARSLFHSFFAYSLYDQISETAGSLKIGGVFFLRFLGVLHILSIGSWFGAFIEFFPVLSLVLILFSVFDLVFVQFKIREINRTLGLSIRRGFDMSDLIALLLIGTQSLAFYLVNE